MDPRAHVLYNATGSQILVRSQISLSTTARRLALFWSARAAVPLPLLFKTYQKSKSQATTLISVWPRPDLESITKRTTASGQRF